MNDLRGEFREAENLLRQGAVRQAVQQAGLVLERFLYELYRELLPKLPSSEAAKVSAAQEEIAKGKSAERLTLGELVALFYRAKLPSAVETHLRKSLKTLANDAMVREWVDLRNRAAHARPEKEIEPHEAEAFLANLKLLLTEAGVLRPPPPREKLPPWWEVATPHRDIQEGKTQLSQFAAKLDGVVAGRADPEYLDPNLFFARTHVTPGLRNLLEAALRRLSGKGGDGVLHIETAFGGGKTHSLIALYHFFGGKAELSQYSWAKAVLEEAEVARPPEVQALTFVGTEADPLGPTPWGIFGKALGKYELVREHDERRQAPGKGVLRELLGGKPTLILMDEIAEFLCRLVEPRTLAGGSKDAARAYQSQVLTFVQELTEVATELPTCLLVLTTTTSTAYGAEGERVQASLQQITSRMHRLLEPVGSADIAEVIRRRLFADVGDPEVHEAVAEKFLALYREQGSGLPEEAKDRPYKDRIVQAYPFHPELIDVLYNQWGSFPEFQRTRGVLRFLALVVERAWRERAPVPLIRPSDVPLEHRELRQILVNCIGREYESVIACDIAGGREIARRLDHHTSEERRPLRLAEGLATAIFLHSFSGAQRPERGATAAQLRLSVLSPEVEVAVVGDTLHWLEENLHYLHKRENRYYFSTELNLVRAVSEAAESISHEQITGEIRKVVEKRVERVSPLIAHVVWPGEAEEVPDRRDGHVLVVLSPDLPFGKEATREFVRTLFDRAGSGFRAFPGALLVLAPDSEELFALKTKVRWLLALREVQRSRAKELSPEDQEKLRKDVQRAESEVVAEGVVQAWRYLALWRGHEEPEWIPLTPHSRANLSLSSVVVEHLKAADRLSDEIAPEWLLALVPVTEKRRYREIWEMFLRTPRMPIVPERAVRAALRKAVSQGLVALESDEKQFFKTDVPDAYLDEAYVLPPGLLPPPPAAPPPPPPPSPGARPSPPPPPRPTRTVYRLKTKVPWERFSDVFRGVIQPLKEKAEELELVIELRAKSAGGFPEEILERKVRETLRQIDAQILEEREE